MRLSGLDFTVFLAYIVVVLALGLYAARRVGGTKRDYFLAGDKLAWWMVGGSMMAANISSHHFVGIMGVAYSKGFAAMNIAWPAVLYCFSSLLWIFLPFYLRNGFYTMPEFLNRRYGAAARSTYGGLILLTYVFVEISAVLYLGAFAIHTMLGYNTGLCIVLLALLTGLYTITGGLRAVVWTEMLQLGVLIVGGLTLSVLTIHSALSSHDIGVSGIRKLSENWHLILPPNDPDFPCTMFIGASLGIGIFYGAANQFMVQRALAAKDEWHARTGIVFASFLNLLMPMVYIVPGLLAPALFKSMGIELEKADSTFPTLVRTLLPAGMIGLVMAGLVAAIMSHISGSLNSCSTIATVDFYLPYIRKNASDKEAVAFGKIMGGVIILIAMFWAWVMISHSDKPVFIYLLNLYGYFAPGLTTMFLIGIFWKRATHAGAMAAGVLTIPLTLFMEWFAPKLPPDIGQYITPFMNRTGIVFWCCMLTAVIVSLLTRPEPKEKLEGMIWNLDSMKLPKEQRSMMRGLRNPLVWWIVVMVIMVALYIKFW